MDREQDYKEMPVEKEVQENADTPILIHLYWEWRYSNQLAAEKATNVHQDGGLLDWRVPNYPQLLHEE